MKAIKVGSLFSGYDGIGLALDSLFPDRIERTWFSEFEPPTKKNPRPSQSAAKILARHWPDVPNHGDITAIDWDSVEPVDIITGGFPCQDLSLAGRRRGMSSETRSGLWSNMAEAIKTLRPSLVIAENVRGLLSAEGLSEVEPCPGCVGDDARVDVRALGVVLADLADIGYDAEWVGLRASDVGAPHERFRVFVVAYPANVGRPRWAEPDEQSGENGRSRNADAAPVPDAQGDGRDEGWAEPKRQFWGSDAAERNRQATADPAGNGFPRIGRVSTNECHADGCSGADKDGHGRQPEALWGIYGSAVRRWELELGRPAPAPTTINAQGNQRLSVEFDEWVMGLPAGHVSDPEIKISRNDRLKACGNGVVPQQAAAAVAHLLARAA